MYGYTIYMYVYGLRCMYSMHVYTYIAVCPNIEYPKSYGLSSSSAAISGAERPGEGCQQQARQLPAINDIFRTTYLATAHRKIVDMWMDCTKTLLEVGMIVPMIIPFME